MARNDEGQSKFPAARSITMVGNLGADPREIQTKGDAGDGAGFTLYVDSRDHKGQDFTEKVDVVIWGFWAKAVLEHYKSGQRISVVGDLYFDEWEDKRKLRLEATLVTKFEYPSDSNSGGGDRGRSRDADSDGDGRRSSRPARDSKDDDEGGDRRDRSDSRRERSSRDDESEGDGGRRSERSSRSSRDDEAPRRERSSARSSSSRDHGDSIAE